MTFDEVKGLSRGTVLHHTINKNADGTPQRWRVNGKVRLWKRDPGRIEVPIKHGLYRYGTITADTLHLVERP